MEYRETLEERGIRNPEEIEKKVASHRRRLQSEYGLLDSTEGFSRQPSREYSFIQWRNYNFCSSSPLLLTTCLSLLCMLNVCFVYLYGLLQRRFKLQNNPYSAKLLSRVLCLDCNSVTFFVFLLHKSVINGINNATIDYNTKKSPSSCNKKANIHFDSTSHCSYTTCASEVI